MPLSTPPNTSGATRHFPLCLFSLLLILVIFTYPEPVPRANLISALPVTSTCKQLFKTIELKVMEADRIEYELVAEFPKVFTPAAKKAALGMTNKYVGKKGSNKQEMLHDIQQRRERIYIFDEKATVHYMLAMQIRGDMTAYASLCCTSRPTMSWKVWKAWQ